jgi:cysteine desulfurase
VPGVGRTAQLASQGLAAMDRVAGLRDRLEAVLLEQMGEPRVQGAWPPRLPNTSFISFRGIKGEALFLKPRDLGVCVSTGSACSTEQREPSHVLWAMGVKPREALGTVRFSLSRYTTEAEIQWMAERVPGLVAELRAGDALARR